ncbi:MAG TPA: metalloregulator ArsR/SmtB family transcription factor [Candidatus Limnocylindrales bacterium]|nr:metalloregulator ArsR/SmtB family transcription factor [Candidatus Limnocylindrales bacterium]
MDEGLLRAFKALADASRLRIVGLLVERPLSVTELADALGLSPGTVVHHLKRLEGAGLVEARPRHPYVEYALRLERLQQIGRDLGRAATQAEPSAVLPGPDGRPRPAFEAKVLRSFFEGGRLASIPAQEKKRRVVLRYLAETVFEAERVYPEKEVNQRLAVLHPDVASLRRHLVDEGFMTRAAGEYRRAPEERWPR